MEPEERLAVMLALGADPFATGVDGKLQAAFEFTKICASENWEVPKEKMEPTLSTIKKTLSSLAEKSDNQTRNALDYASSAEAVQFLCDLGASPIHQYDMQVPEAVGAWLKRNPSALDMKLFSPQALLHPFFKMPAKIIKTYLDAIRAKELSEGGTQESVAKTIRTVLDWSGRLHSLTLVERTQTLFLCAGSIESAEVVLEARIGARLGEEPSEWENWRDREWNFLFSNREIVPPRSSVAPIELAVILVRHDVYPSSSIMSHPDWPSYETFVRDCDSANELSKLIQCGKRSFDDLAPTEAKLVAAHAYRVVSKSSSEQCENYWTKLCGYLTSVTRCDRETRLAFLETAYAGKNLLNTSDKFKQHLETWNGIVGRVGYTFRSQPQGSLSTAGILGKTREYIGKLSNQEVLQRRNS